MSQSSNSRPDPASRLPARVEMQQRMDPLIAERAPWLYSGKPHHTLARALMMRLLRYPRSIALASEFRDLPTEEIMRRISALIVRDILHIVAELRDAGVTVLLVEQNARAALQVADYAYVLETGAVTLEGPAAQVAEDPRVVSARAALMRALF